MVSPRGRILVENVTASCGFDLPRGSREDALIFASAQVPGTIQIGLEGESYRVTSDLPGVARQLAVEIERGELGAVLERGHSFIASDGAGLHAILTRVFDLSLSLPTQPLEVFRQQTLSLPRSTEAERLVIQRVGQEVFREALEHFWQGRCAVTQLTDRALLRASHIKPWAACEDDAERLDVFNGILLAVHLDALFDRALMTFDKEGRVVFSKALSEAAMKLLDPTRAEMRVELLPEHQAYLDHHRERFHCYTASEW